MYCRAPERMESHSLIALIPLFYGEKSKLEMIVPKHKKRKCDQ